MVGNNILYYGGSQFHFRNTIHPSDTVSYSSCFMSSCCIPRYNYIQRHPRISSWLSRRFGGKFLDTLKTVPKSRCFDIYFLSINPIGTIFFLLSSLLGLIIYGYFYCFCLLYMLVSVDVIQHVLNAVIGKGKILYVDYIL